MGLQCKEGDEGATQAGSSCLFYLGTWAGGAVLFLACHVKEYSWHAGT